MHIGSNRTHNGVVGILQAGPVYSFAILYAVEVAITVQIVENTCQIVVSINIETEIPPCESESAIQKCGIQQAHERQLLLKISSGQRASHHIGIYHRLPVSKDVPETQGRGERQECFGRE